MPRNLFRDGVSGDASGAAAVPLGDDIDFFGLKLPPDLIGEAVFLPKIARRTAGAYIKFMARVMNNYFACIGMPGQDPPVAACHADALSTSHIGVELERHKAAIANCISTWEIEEIRGRLRTSLHDGDMCVPYLHYEADGTPITTLDADNSSSFSEFAQWRLPGCEG